MTHLTLTPAPGAGPSHRFDLAAPAAVTIGRSHDCSLWLGDPTVSRHHCLIEIIEGAAWVRDLGSLNGTFLNGRLLGGPPDAAREPAGRLGDGDELPVAGHVFWVGLQEESAPSCDEESAVAA